MRVVLAILLAVLGTGVCAQEIPECDAARARETLPDHDGWAASGAGTTGGSLATSNDVFVASNREELLASLSGTAPKIVFIEGRIDLNEGMTCSDYAAGTVYTIEAFLAAYDPATWGRRLPSGPLEDARVAARARQRERVRVNVSSNTTLIGLGSDATLVGAHVRIHQASNVIVRNVTFEDAYDCFPQWDPTENVHGEWNSGYDNLSLTEATNVWVDHCEFNDGAHPDTAQPLYYGRPFQMHDGLLDITDGSDLVTVSWNRFLEHEKTMLVGNAHDTAMPHENTLRVTLHHNVFDASVERTPRVMYGRVHVYNNYYRPAPARYGYSWGVGVESQIFAEDNYFETAGLVAPSRFIYRFDGWRIHVGETLVDGHAVDIVAAFNTIREPDLWTGLDWSPALVGQRHPTATLPDVVPSNAGPFHELCEPEPPRLPRRRATRS